MSVSVARNIDKGYVNRKVANKFANDTDQVNMCLSLFQRLLDIIAV